MSKTEQIRQALMQHPNASVSKLATKFKVSTGLIYGIRGAMKDARNPIVQPRPIVKVDGVKHTIDTIINMKKLAESVGGFDRLIELADALR